MTNDDKRIETFARAAELYESASDLRTAVQVLRRGARAIRPTELVLLTALRAGYEALKQWSKLVDVIGAIAEIEPLLHDKAQRRFEQADLLLGRLRCGTRRWGPRSSRRRFEDDPTHERALAAMVAVHLAARRVARPGAGLREARGRLRPPGGRRARVEVCKKLGQLRRRTSLRTGRGRSRRSPPR